MEERVAQTRRQGGAPGPGQTQAREPHQEVAGRAHRREPRLVGGEVRLGQMGQALRPEVVDAWLAAAPPRSGMAVSPVGAPVDAGYRDREPECHAGGRKVPVGICCLSPEDFAARGSGYRYVPPDDRVLRSQRHPRESAATSALFRA